MLSTLSIISLSVPSRSCHGALVSISKSFAPPSEQELFPSRLARTNTMFPFASTVATEGSHSLKMCLHFLLLVFRVYSVLLHISPAPAPEDVCMYVCNLICVN